MGDTSIGFGILGSGNMARVYGDALRDQVPDARLVAVALGSRAGSLAAEFGVTAEPTAEALLARRDVDVVVIATPHSTHLPLSLQTAAAGKHVYLEKPMALNVAECDAIIEACRSAGVQLTIAKQTRHMQMAMKAKELIDEGRIGEIRYLRPMSIIAGMGIAAGNHWSEKPGEGDAFLDWGSHCCDAIRWLSGAEPVRVYADFEDFTGLPLSGTTAAVQFRLSNKAIAQVLMCYDVPPSGLGAGTGRNNQYLIVGSEGSIFWDLDRIDLVTGNRITWSWDLPSWTLPDFKPRDPRRIGNSARQVQAFVEALRDGRPPAITGADGRAAIEMAQATTLSAATHRAVDFPLAAGSAGSAGSAGASGAAGHPA
jgi:myo-inositol 2-dehydrogenase/D-chiro-inositol 1-dehydrogenase